MNRLGAMAALTAAATMTMTAASAEENAFMTGPLLEGLGPNVSVPGAAPIAKDAVFKIAFDTAEPGKDGGLNRTLTTAARFLNMHARAGVSPNNLSAAVVIHGKAVFDVSAGEAGEAHRDLIAALTAHNVRIVVCGQSAGYHNVSADDLLPGVEMALSAITAHALLQQDGYTLNPF